MFSGKKFRLWSRQPPAVKKETEREQQTRTKNRSGQQGKADGENITTIASIVSPLYHDNTQTQVIQKLREDNSRLEDIIKELTPYKIQSVALEKKLIATTKAFEKKEIKYTASISSLEYENEQLREEIKRARFVCSGCYFCARTQQHQFQHNQDPLSAKLFASPPPPPPSKDFPSRNDDGSIDSMQSGESWRRLERLEETQSAIFKETSRQKQETSRCLQQITNELVKALTSQKSLRQDCTQMQDRIYHLEKQNERLNKVIFRQHTPSSSTSSSLQTRHPTVRRNEPPVVIARSDVGQTVFWNDFPAQKICPTDVKTAEEINPVAAKEVFSSSPYAPPYHTRFGHENSGRAPENCAPNDNHHIPEEIVRDNAMSTAVDDNTSRGVGDSVPSKHLVSGRNCSRGESEPGTGRNLGWSYSYRRQNDSRDVCGDWDASTSSVSAVTLQDETQEPRCKKSGSNYSLNDILDGDIDELRLSIQNLESTRQEKRRSSRSLQCSVNEVFEEPAKMHGQPQSGHSSSVERGKRYSHPGSPLVRSGPTPEKQLMLGEAIGVDGAAQRTQHCGNTAVLLLPDKQKQLEAALQKIESVINNGSTNEIRSNNNSSLDVECQDLQEDHTVTDTNTEDATSDEDLAWNSVGKERRFGDLGQEEEEEERALLQSDSQTDVSESDQTDGISTLVEDDNTSEEGRFVSALNAMKPQTSQQEREKTPVLQYFTSECLHPDNSTKEETKQCIKSTDRQATAEAKLFSQNDRKLETSESGKMTVKSEDKISVRRHSLTNDNLSTDTKKDIAMSKDMVTALTEAKLFSQNNRKLETSESGKMTMKSEGKITVRRHSLTNDNFSTDTKKDIAMSKDMVTALTAYFEEVHAEQCPGCQHTKSRSSSFASRSSSSSKENSSFDDNDAGNTCSGIHDHADDFRTIRHQRSAAKTAEETDAHNKAQVHASGSEKTLVEDPLMETSAPRTKPSESESVIGGGCVQPSQNTDLDHHPVGSTPDFITPVDLQTGITVSQGKSQRNETPSLQEPLEQAPQGSGAPQNLPEEDGKMSSACTNEITNTSAMTTGCEFDEQTQCQSLSSTGESASPLHVNYVRTCSLKSFWDVVTPPSSPRVEKLGEGRMFPDTTTQCNIGNAIADKTDIAQVHGSSDSQDDCVQSKSEGEESLEREITPVSTEDGEDHSQNYPPLPLPRQPLSGGMADTKRVRGDFEDDRWYGIPLEEDVVFKCEFPESHQQPEASRHEFTESSPDGKIRDSGGSEAEHLPVVNWIQSEKTELSGIDEEQREALSGGTLTEKDIRKYQLGCHDYSGQQGCHDDYSGHQQGCHDDYSGHQQGCHDDYSGHQQGCHDDYSGHQQGCYDYSGNDAVEEDHLWLPMQQITELDCSENQRGLSSKPPLPPKRFHSTQYYAQESSNRDQEIPDYEELREYIGTESSPYDNRRNLMLESERYAFHYPKTEAHIPGSPSAVSTGFQSALQIQKNPVQFRSYSKSWDSGKRNSYPAARFRSYSQPEEQWDNVASTESWRYPVAFERNVRPLSDYQVRNTSSRVFSTDVPSRVSLAVRQQRQHREESQKSKDVENDLVFHEITKQIESLQQTVNELQNREADSSNSMF